MVRKVFRGGPKQNAIELSLILIGDGGNLFRHGKDHVEVFECLKVRLDDPGAIEPGRAIGILGNADWRMS